MATVDNTSNFARFILSSQEQLMGSIYTYEQKLIIQNKLSEIADSKLALTVDPNNYAAYVQQEAYLAGQISILRYLLDCSIASEQQLLDNASKAAGNN